MPDEPQNDTATTTAADAGAPSVPGPVPAPEKPLVTAQADDDTEFDAPRPAGEPPAEPDTGFGIAASTDPFQEASEQFVPNTRTESTIAAAERIVARGGMIACVRAQRGDPDDAASRAREARAIVSLNGILPMALDAIGPHRHAMEGFGVGFWTGAGPFEVGSPENVTSLGRQWSEQGIMTWEGVVFKPSWKTRKGEQPRHIVYIAGPLDITQRIMRNYTRMAGIPKSHVRFSAVEVQDATSARMVVFIEMPRKLIERAWPGITKLPGYKRYLEALARWHAAIGEENGQRTEAAEGPSF